MAIHLVQANDEQQQPLTQVGGGRGRICFRSDLPDHSRAIEELSSPQVRVEAIKQAGLLGLAGAACEFPGHPYAVDQEGREIQDPARQKIDHYRVEVPVMSRFR